MLQNEKSPYDLVVVLGSGVHEDYSLPEDSLMRMEAATILYELRIATRLLLSGGRTTKDSQVPGEAEVMYAWLKAQREKLKTLFFPNKELKERILEGSVSMDVHAVSTTDNLRGLQRLLREQPWLANIAVITNRYHATRVEEMAKNMRLPVTVISAEDVLIQHGGNEQEDRVQNYYATIGKNRWKSELIARLLLKLDPYGVIPQRLGLQRLPDFQEAA